MQGFHVENFGCRASRADGEAVSERLRSAGLCEQQPGEAGVVVVNTCSVTAEADRAARAFIRRTNRRNPQARIVVTGCYAQRAPQELAGLAGVAAVVGNSHKALAPQIALDLIGNSGNGAGFSTYIDQGNSEKRKDVSLYIDQGDSEKGAGFSPYIHQRNMSGASAPEGSLLPIQSLLSSVHAPIWADDRFAHSFLEEARLIPGEQTRPSLKIQEGCGNRCTFCVIPLTRGPSRSLPAAGVLNQVRSFVAAGGNELVLSGINLGRWGRDLPDSPSASGSLLAALVRRIFRETDLKRLRLSSIEPMDWDAEMIALMADFGGSQPGPPATGLHRWGGRLCRHVHLPLQSGSDAVLRRMHRRYRPWHYEEKVASLIAAAGPDLTLGADVMAGFPGETDAEFEETLKFVRALPFGYLHLFPFSPRPGTRGWALHAQSPVPTGVVEERMAALRTLAAEKSRAHREQFVGRELEAITLHTPPRIASKGRTSALTENFLPVEIVGSLPSNRLVRVCATALNSEMTLEAKETEPSLAQYAATAMSVRANSVPFESSSSPVSLARA